MTIQYSIYHWAFILQLWLSPFFLVSFLPHSVSTCSSNHKLPFHNAFMRSIICLLKSMLPHNMLQHIYFIYFDSLMVVISPAHFTSSIARVCMCSWLFRYVSLESVHQYMAWQKSLISYNNIVVGSLKNNKINGYYHSSIECRVYVYSILHWIIVEFPSKILSTWSSGKLVWNSHFDSNELWWRISLCSTFREDWSQQRIPLPQA